MVKGGCSVREPEAESVCGLPVYTTLTTDYTFDGAVDGQRFTFAIPMCEPHYIALTASLEGDFSAYSIGTEPEI